MHPDWRLRLLSQSTCPPPNVWMESNDLRGGPEPSFQVPSTMLVIQLFDTISKDRPNIPR
ncbi:hypothetical protein DACRYDRAFT_22501 [Dacryopinax primogenitus]|uniref:Uncharacterized protein n=1 Tax=Dacryopinax primogenitus (strain DJM 731) TaxID=1858805 RepID=M5FZL0_DACPD|nr:uncharacterized protein DACRYDRAFT_22501 [Dacryopinax primogenitus]EJU01320.1 hypothetical protein DACRYDRAFT_22501 [Dacryopinax primogenitus]